MQHNLREREWDTLTMLSKGQDRPVTGPPKVKKRQVVLNLDTKAEIYAKLQQWCIDDSLSGYFAVQIGVGPGGSG